jgi:fructoselysine-6-P-deglycase FrlB-like protein
VKILVCGSHSWRWRDEVRERLAELADRAAAGGAPLEVVTAGAGGADRLAEDVARELGVDRVVFRSGWDEAGRASRHDHVPRMLGERPDLVLAFRDAGESPGTDRIIRSAREAGIPVTEVPPPA